MSRMQGRVKVKACTQLKVDKNNLRKREDIEKIFFETRTRCVCQGNEDLGVHRVQLSRWKLTRIIYISNWLTLGTHHTFCNSSTSSIYIELVVRRSKILKRNCDKRQKEGSLRINREINPRNRAKFFRILVIIEIVILTLDYLSSSVVSKRFVLKDQVIFVTFLRINFINCVSKLERIYNEKALVKRMFFQWSLHEHALIFERLIFFRETLVVLSRVTDQTPSCFLIPRPSLLYACTPRKESRETSTLLDGRP